MSDSVNGTAGEMDDDMHDETHGDTHGDTTEAPGW